MASVPLMQYSRSGLLSNIVENMADVIHFVCQYCSQPLQLNEGFSELEADTEEFFVKSATSVESFATDETGSKQTLENGSNNVTQHDERENFSQADETRALATRVTSFDNVNPFGSDRTSPDGTQDPSNWPDSGIGNQDVQMNADECAQTAQGQIDGGDPRKLSAETISRPQLQPGMVDDDGVDICQPIQWTESLLVVRPRRPSNRDGPPIARRMSANPDELSGSTVDPDGVVRMRIRRRSSERQGAGEGFVLLSSQGEQKGDLSHTIRITNKLFDVMSGHTDIDFPLCSECTDYLVAELETNVAETEALTEEYAAFMEMHVIDDKEAEEERQKTTADLEQLQQEEAELLRQLQAVELARTSCREEVSKLRAEEEELQLTEQRLWQSVNEFQRQFDNYVAQRDSMDMRCVHAMEQLARLKRTNIFNDTFHIAASGPFGTINGFRMGRTTTEQVSWDEINAAWGQAVVLLHAMAARLGLIFQRFKLIPMGSRASVERLENHQQLELWLTGGFQPFQSSRYDNAMVAYLMCLAQFRDSIELRDPRFNLPYSINKDLIQGVSIRRGAAGEEEWTKACKYMLTDLKWALMWMVKIVLKEILGVRKMSDIYVQINYGP